MLSKKNKICLVGFMGVGKSTFGKKFAKHLGSQFYDTDKLISERESLSINEIFAQKGEVYFRAKEKEVLLQLLDLKEASVIATGGGIGANKELMEIMKEHTTVMLLFLPLEAVFKRLEGRSKNRPLVNSLKERDFKQGIEVLYKKRLPIYMEADVIIDAHHLKKITKEELQHLLDDNSAHLLTKQDGEV